MNAPISLILNYQTNLSMKSHPQFCYYIDGSLKNLKNFNMVCRKEKKQDITYTLSKVSIFARDFMNSKIS